MLLEILIVGIAVLGAALFLHDPAVKPREIIPYTARNGVPSLVERSWSARFSAKVISTANNYLFSPATNLVNDVYTRFLNRDASDRAVLRVSRVLIVVLGLFALLQGTVSESILAMSLYAYTVYAAAVTPVVLPHSSGAAPPRPAPRCASSPEPPSPSSGTCSSSRSRTIARRSCPRDGSSATPSSPRSWSPTFSLVLASLLTRAPAPKKRRPFAATDAGTA